MFKIYSITNSITGDFYIGVTKRTLNIRMHEHLGAARNGNATHLCNAIRKYGENNFSISLIEEVTENAAEREIYYIDSLNPRYNMTKGGDGVTLRFKRICITNGEVERYLPDGNEIPYGWRRCQIKRIKQRGKKRDRSIVEIVANKHRGMKRSKESCYKMSIAAKQRTDRKYGPDNPLFGKPQSQSHKDAIANDVKGKNAKKISIKGIIYPSLHHASTITGISASSLSLYARNPKKLTVFYV